LKLLHKVLKIALTVASLTCTATSAEAQTFTQWMTENGGATHVGVQVKIERFSPAMAQQIKAAGLEFVRFGVWVNAMPRDTYRAEVDRAFDAARQAGLLVILTVRDTAPLISVDITEKAARDEQLRIAADRLSGAVVGLARSYSSDILAVELWNEPEWQKYWPTGNTDATFPAYMREVCAGIDSVRASTPVIGFAFATRPASGSRSDELLQETGTSTHHCLDAVSWHGYSKSAHEIADASRYVRSRYGLPTVMTEWGVSSGNPSSTKRQAAAIGEFLREENDPSTPLISLYEWQDSANAENSKERNFGLVDASGKRKPALDAVESALKKH
jgi:polysaccharide biosynthesis protein PslG